MKTLTSIKLIILKNKNIIVISLLILIIFLILVPLLYIYNNKKYYLLRNNPYVDEIHDKLKMKHGDFKKKSEYWEQTMIEKYIKPDSKILELGPNIGYSSLLANYKLIDKNNHLCIETIKDNVNALKENRDLNNAKFKIFTGAISSKPLYQKGWRCYDYPIENSVKVNTKTFDEIKKEFNINFDTIIADCEGCIVPILKENVSLLKNIKLIIIEHDFSSIDDLNYFNNLMKNNNFKLIDKILKKDVGLENWTDGVISDKIFVSVLYKVN